MAPTLQLIFLSLLIFFQVTDAQAQFVYNGRYDDFDQKLYWSIRGKSDDEKWQLSWGNEARYKDDDTETIKVILRPPTSGDDFCDRFAYMSAVTVSWFRVNAAGNRGSTKTTKFNWIRLVNEDFFLTSEIPEASELIDALIDGGSIRMRYSSDCGTIDGRFSLTGVPEALDKLHTDKMR